MSNILNVEVGNETASTFLEPYIQSGNLNFLIGSGASAPAIKTAATIENEINKLLSDGKEDHANRKCLDFLSEINFANSRIASGNHATTKTVAESYAEFLSGIDKSYSHEKILYSHGRPTCSLLTTTFSLSMPQA